MRQFRLALLSASLIALLTGCKTAPLPAAACAGKIIFASPEGASYNVFSVEPNGSDLQRLTDSNALNGTPAISHQQDRIAFSAHNDGENALYVMEIDGTAKTKVLESEHPLTFPLWSPTAQDELIFLHRGGSNLRELRKISLNTPDSAKTIEIDFPDFFLAEDLSHSPTGESVAFGSITMMRGGSHVYVIDLKSRKMTNLTGLSIANVLKVVSRTNALKSSNHPLRAASDPNWSPDGSRLVFVGTQQEPITEGGMSEIYTMNRNGRDRKIVEVNLYGQKSQPVWSPDGTQIAFINDRNAIYKVNVDGSNLIKIIDIDDGAQFQALGLYEPDLAWQAVPCHSH